LTPGNSQNHTRQPRPKREASPKKLAFSETIMFFMWLKYTPPFDGLGDLDWFFVFPQAVNVAERSSIQDSGLL
jgi:hypothetical protein